MRNKNTEFLLKRAGVIRTVGALPEEITSLCDRADRAENGSVFFCRKGVNGDGREYVGEAVGKGARLVVAEEEFDCPVALAIVNDVIRAEAETAKAFYGDPQNDIKLIGVVGTNGKTSVCHILREIFGYAGRKAFVAGTIGVFFGEERRPCDLTTPGLLDLYALIAEARDRGAEFFVTEVSAHAIDQRRIEGLYFEILVFTNCTEDHLDYFGTFGRYSAVKKSVFGREKCRRMLVNSDDPLGIVICAENEGVALSYGIENPADVFAIDAEESASGISYVINLFDAVYDVSCPLVGGFNVYNTLAAAACAALCGVSVSDIAEGLARMAPVPGRGEFVSSFRGGSVFVDYAHTPDGLFSVLTSFRKLCGAKLLVVFGCGGNREREKRPVMGRIAGELADFVVITSDNPRYEDPLAVMREVEEGVRLVTRNYISVSDRREAISYALSRMKEGDILVVAGKGAEEYQETNGVKIKFSDRETVLALAEEIG